MPKKIGDLFADYLATKHNKNFSEYFKDKSSLKSLNAYLLGKKTLEHDGFKRETQDFIRDFAEFAAYVEYDLQSGSKALEKSTKYCQKIILQNFNGVFKVLITSGKIDRIVSFEIQKIWPNLKINYSFTKDRKKQVIEKPARFYYEF